MWRHSKESQYKWCLECTDWRELDNNKGNWQDEWNSSTVDCKNTFKNKYLVNYGAHWRSWYAKKK